MDEKVIAFVNAPIPSCVQQFGKMNNVLPREEPPSSCSCSDIAQGNEDSRSGDAATPRRLAIGGCNTCSSRRVSSSPEPDAVPNNASQTPGRSSADTALSRVRIPQNGPMITIHQNYVTNQLNFYNFADINKLMCTNHL